MSYRTAILIDRYVKTFSDSENQPQRTTTVQYNSSLISGDDTMSEITTAAIGNYPTHSIPDVVSSPFSLEATGTNGSPIITNLERQTNLQSTHRVTIGGVTYVRVPYRYGYVVNANGKRYISIVQPGDERFVWHSNLDEEGAEGFDWDTFFEEHDGTRLDPIPEELRGSFIFTADQGQNYTVGEEIPQSDKVWPALKILTDEDFKAVYQSDDYRYYFVVEVEGTELLLGDIYTGSLELDEYEDGEFLKGELLPEPVDAAIMNEGQEEIVSVDMKFGDEWYRVAGTDEVIHVIIPEQQGGEEQTYTLVLAGGNLSIAKVIRSIAQYRGESYGDMTTSELVDYVNQHKKSVPAGSRVDYPADFTETEQAAIEDVIAQTNASFDSETDAVLWTFVKKTEFDENKPPYRMMFLENGSVTALKDVMTVSRFFDPENGPYNTVATARDYVSEHLNNITGELVYPRDFSAEEIGSFTDAVEADPDMNINGEFYVINAE